MRCARPIGIALAAWVLSCRAGGAASSLTPSPTLVSAQPPALRAAPPASGQPALASVHVDVARVLASIVPDRDVGTSIDALPDGVVDRVYSPGILGESLSAGWGPLSYRQNTELRIAAWHWNPRGRWSEETAQRGYFTGSPDLGEPIRHSYGYWLPHRGDTRNEGANDGFSRLTDGRQDSYWKSNPYLTRRFTGEDHDNPQWVVVDLGSRQPVDALRIDWGSPYARSFDVQYWTGEEAMTEPGEGEWVTFARGAVRGARGGRATLKLADAPLAARFVRVWMTESSDTCDSHGPGDPRNCVGFAMREISAGTLTKAGAFADATRHAPDQSQTVAHASSVDPWHAASDLHDQGYEVDQTGLDLFYTSGITGGLPAVIPVSLLYGTPEDSVAEISYLKKRGYPIGFVEMGEEPDGQYTLPEDYAALFLQWAAAIHRVAPELKLGGPSFTGVSEDVPAWADAQGKRSWLGRFLAYLSARGRLSDFAFLSFEHYPYEPCKIDWPDLYREPEIIAHIMQVWRSDGLPDGLPMLITESNVAPDLTRAMVEVFGALWLTDSVGAFFASGGSGYYHSPIQPEPLERGCDGLTTYGNFVADSDFRIRGHTAQYFASRLINLEWLQKGGGAHQMVFASSDVKDEKGNALVTSYAVRRPDGEWSLLLVNRDASRPHDVRLVFDGVSQAGPAGYAGPVRVVTFGSGQYAWQADSSPPGPAPDGPWIATTARGDVVTLPQASATVVRGRVGL